MTNAQKPFRPMHRQTAVIVLLALLAGTLAFFAVRAFNVYIIENYLLTESSVHVRSPERLMRVGVFLAVLADAAVVTLILVQRAEWITRRITRLTAEVNAVSQGDFSAPISTDGRDEITSLARDVDRMRDAIIRSGAQEQSALQANSELITALSHDLRNPLTALIGYLELLEMDQDALPERDRDYLHASLDKGYRIRELMSELFSYFLVFGKEIEPPELEEYDAQSLLLQLLGECIADLQSQGFKVDAEPLETVCTLRTDVSLMKRVVDNLSSNISKYADPAETIWVRAWEKDGMMTIQITNRIAEQTAGLVESSHIGLRVCASILHMLGGRFSTRTEGDTFIAECLHPVQKPQ